MSFSVGFAPEHNISYLDFLALRYQGTDQDILIQLTGTGDYAGSYYDSTTDLWGEALKDELHDTIHPHTDLGYSGARQIMYGIIDNENNTLECVYTGFTQYWPYGDPGTFPDPINCEHTWPQAFFNSNNPMRGDIFHLYPTHMDANSIRGSYPFGNVTSGINWNQGGSKRGNNSYGEIVFEPRDIHKGDAARSIFYFTTCYGNLGNYLGSHQEEDLREWYLSDPVSEEEMQRNSAIYSYQNNRNPFIDHPEFIERISSFSQTASSQLQQPQLNLIDGSIDLNQVNQTYRLLIGNGGNSVLFIQNIDITSEYFHFSSTASVITAGNTGTIQVTLLTQEPGLYSDMLSFQSNDPAQDQVNIPLAAVLYNLGDINRDSYQDVLDVVMLVDIILNNPPADELTLYLADLGADQMVDILDVVALVGLILGQ